MTEIIYDEMNEWRKVVSSFREKEIPIAKTREMEKAHRIPRELIKRMADVGIIGCCFPEEYGGQGLGVEAYVVCAEELGHCFASIGTFWVSSIGLALAALNLGGNDEQKRRYLAPAIAGEKIGAFSLSEEGAGSYPMAMKLRADLDGDSWVLNGTKRFTSTGDLADFIITFARTGSAKDKKFVAFVVDKTTPGLKISRLHKNKTGLWASDTADFEFVNVRVPKENQLGEVGDGLKLALRIFVHAGRIGLVACILGLLKAIRWYSMDNAAERVVSGDKLINQDLYKEFLANISRDIYLLDCAVYDTVRRLDRGEDIEEETAILKYAGPDMVLRNVRDAFRFYGGDAFSDDMHELAIAYRDAPIQDIYEGPREIQILLIAHYEIVKFMRWLRKNTVRIRSSAGKTPAAVTYVEMLNDIRSRSMQDASRRNGSDVRFLKRDLYKKLLASISSDIYLLECATSDLERRMNRGEQVEHEAAILRYAGPDMVLRNVDEHVAFSRGSRSMAAYRNAAIRAIYGGQRAAKILHIADYEISKFTQSQKK